MTPPAANTTEARQTPNVFAVAKLASGAGPRAHELVKRAEGMVALLGTEKERRKTRDFLARADVEE